jgi:hypothetical protein
MPDIVIQGTTINFPDSGESPNWADAVIAFAEAVEVALEGATGTYDVSPQSYTIDLFNNVSNQNIPGLTFPTSQVRAANLIRYAVYRTSSLQVAYESGTMIAVYNSNGGSWEMTRDYVGDGKIAFNITNTGQVQFSTATTSGTTAAPLTGTGHTGKIIFAAQALLQS